MIFLLIKILFLMLAAAALGALGAFFWIRHQYEDVTDSHDRLLANVSRLSALDQFLTRDDFNAGLAGLEPNLKPIETRIDAQDQTLTALAERLSRLQNTDLSPINQRLVQIQSEIAAIDLPQTNLEPIEGHLEGLENRLTALGEDLGDIGGPSVDIDPLRSGLASLTTAVSGLRSPDLSPVMERLQRLDQTVAAMRPPEPNLTPIKERVDDAARRVQTAVENIPPTDLSPVLDTVIALDGRLDLTALENRLTSIEYGLAAVHDMLRTRGTSSVKASFGGRGATSSDLAGSPQLPAPSRPARAIDPINPHRRGAGDANLLQSAAFGPADDLTQIDGIGPIIRDRLNEIGVYYFWQIAEWTSDEASMIDRQMLHFQGRIERDNWIDAARARAPSPHTARRPGAPPAN